MPYDITRPQDLISAQSQAVTFGLQPHISQEGLLESQLPAFEQYTEQKAYQDYLTKQDKMAQEGYRMAKRQGYVDLGAKTVGLGIQSAPVLKKYGPKVLNALTKPFQPPTPVVNAIEQGTGYQTTGGQVASEIGLDTTAVPTATPQAKATGEGLLTKYSTNYNLLGAEDFGIKPEIASPINLGLGVAAKYGIEQSNFGETMHEAGIGGEKEWDLAATSLAALAFGGPLGLGLNLLGNKGIQNSIMSLFDK